MSRKKQDVYVAVDIEADGPLPGINSLLSLGAAAFVVPPEGTFDAAAHRTPIWTYEANMKPIPGGVEDSDTMEWWARQDPKVWAHVTADQRDPEDVMGEFARALKDLPGDPVMWTYPSWDYMWVHWYLTRFTNKRSPFGLGCLDMKSYGFAVFDNITRFKTFAKKAMPKWMHEGTPKHTHQALDDAIGQGIQFVNLISWQRSRDLEG